MFPAHWLQPLQRLDTLATLCEDEIFLTTPSPARFLWFPWRNWPFPVLFVVNCPDFDAMVTALSCPLTYALLPRPPNQVLGAKSSNAC